MPLEKTLGFVHRVSSFNFRAYFGDDRSNRLIGTFPSLANAREPLLAAASKGGFQTSWEISREESGAERHVLSVSRSTLSDCPPGEGDDFVEVGYHVLAQWYADRGFYQFIRSRARVDQFDFLDATFGETVVSRDLEIRVAVKYEGARGAEIVRESDGAVVWRSKQICWSGQVNLGKQLPGDKFRLVLRGMPPAFATLEIPRGPYLDQWQVTAEGNAAQIFVRATYRLAASAKIVRDSDQALVAALPSGSQVLAQAVDLPSGASLADAFRLVINDGELVSEPAQAFVACWQEGQVGSPADAGAMPMYSGETLPLPPLGETGDGLWVDALVQQDRENLTWVADSGELGLFPVDLVSRFGARNYSFLEPIRVVYRGETVSKFFVLRTVEPKLLDWSIASNGSASELTFTANYTGASSAVIVRMTDGVTVKVLPKGSYSGTDQIDLASTGSKLSDGFQLVLNRGSAASDVQRIRSSLTSWSVSSTKQGMILDYAASYRGAGSACIVRVSDGKVLKTLLGGTSTELGNFDLLESGSSFSDAFRLVLNDGEQVSEPEHVTPAIVSWVVDSFDGGAFRYSVSYRGANSASVVRSSDGTVLQSLPSGTFEATGSTLSLEGTGVSAGDSIRLALNDGRLLSAEVVLSA